MFSAVETDAVKRSIGASYGEVTAISQTMKNFGGALGLAVFTTIVTSQLSDRLTTSFTALGASPADEAKAVDLVSGASGGGNALGNLPDAVREQFLSAVRGDYAASVQWAFAGMAVSMAVVMLLALLYPAATRASVEASDADTLAAAGSRTTV
ncbi:hypothetical protein ACC691_36000 [Rhizobium johnstonii]|uniref:hypothetical protein n=1 Tax=Rhizobium johnstonii TaxID=3019933 RepID=UPI003F9719E3